MSEMGLLLGNTFQIDIALEFLKDNVLYPLILLHLSFLCSQASGNLPYLAVSTHTSCGHRVSCCSQVSVSSAFPWQVPLASLFFHVEPARISNYKLPLRLASDFLCPMQGCGCFLEPIRICLICLSFHFSILLFQF